MTQSLAAHPHVAEWIRKEPVVVADVGARRESGSRWMAPFPAVEIWAFDPDPEECRLIEARFAAIARPPNRLRAFPVALSDVDGRETLYVTAKPDCSSLFRPNRELLARFADVERFAVLREETVEVNRLDRLRQESRGPSIDLIKLDVQGAELKVLKGARECLADCLALEIEVEFSPLYEGQALFSDIDSFVRAAGFTLFDIRAQRWCRTCEAPRDPYAGGKQLIWGDAIYLRDDGASAGPPRRLVPTLKLALMAEHYGFRDYARELLGLAQQRWGGEFPWLRECVDLLAWKAPPAAPAVRRAPSFRSLVKRAVRKILSTEP